jgi:hypothetical protein
MASNANFTKQTPTLRTQGYGVTERRDAWWWEQVFTLVALGGFSVYAFWAVSQNAYFEAGPYLSPFYSPNLAHMFPALAQWLPFSPAFLVLWIPLGFRGTCYFYRRTYYRAIFNSPPACAVDKPKGTPANYTGERGFPFVLQNLHRYFLYFAIVLAAFQWVHVAHAFSYNGQLGFGLGTLIMLADAILLTLYVFSCHSVRHAIGGRLNTFTNGWLSKFRFKVWGLQTVFNQEHWFYAWASLFTVGLADVYIRLLAMGVLQDWNTWGWTGTYLGCAG